MKQVFKNDFKRWHFSFMSLYIITYIVGLLRGSSTFFYKAHPIVGISSVVIPFLVYLTAKNKKMIRSVIKSNFNLKGSTPIKIAKLSTMVILVYYVFSVLTGFLLNNSLYGTFTIYNVLSTTHSIAKFLVPIAVLSHVAARLYIKFRAKGKKAK